MTDDPFRRRRAIEMRTPRLTRFQPHTPLGDGAEFDVIRRMLERWGPRARRIGDDAAVITSVGERALVVSTDTSMENVHFRREWLRPEEIGYRAAAAALSDLAAMGAKPLGMLSRWPFPTVGKKHRCTFGWHRRRRRRSRRAHSWRRHESRDRAFADDHRPRHSSGRARAFECASR